jgi:hypothetical protein
LVLVEALAITVWISRRQCWLIHIIGETAITNLAKVFWLHAGLIGNLTHLGHGLGSQFLGAAVNKGTHTGILTRLDILKHKLELFF